MDVVWYGLDQIWQFQYLREIVVSIVILVIRKVVIQWWLNRLVQSTEGQYENLVVYRKRILLWMNWGTLGLLFLIWFAQVQNVFLSLIAIAAALVVATKELILCFMGGLYLRFGKAYSVKDRIEVHGIRGFVLEVGLTYTRVLEIGPEKESQQTTGTVITIPNSILLNNSIKNESFFGNYSIRSFSFHLPQEIPVECAESFLVSFANKIVTPYHEAAQKEIIDFCKLSGLALPSVHTRVKVLISATGSVLLLLKIPVENHRIADVEQSLIRGFLSFVRDFSVSKEE